MGGASSACQIILTLYIYLYSLSVLLFVRKHFSLSTSPGFELDNTVCKYRPWSFNAKYERKVFKGLLCAKLRSLHWYWCIVFGTVQRAELVAWVLYTMMSRKAHTATPQCWIYSGCRLISEQLALYKHCRCKFKAGGCCVGSGAYCVTVEHSLYLFCVVLFSLRDFIFIVVRCTSRSITGQ